MTFLVLASVVVSSFLASDFDDWVSYQTSRSTLFLSQNVNPSESRPGSVAEAKASGRDSAVRHDVRVASLALIQLLPLTVGSERAKWQRVMHDHFLFTRQIQNSSPLSGDALGEPVFSLRATPLNKEYKFPHLEAAALRAVLFSDWAQILIRRGGQDYVNQYLFDLEDPRTPLVRDLNYISSQWATPSFDLWGEVVGRHFFQLLVQRRALMKGLELARLNSVDVETWKNAVADIEKSLVGFWNGRWITPTQEQSLGPVKGLELDSSVLLAALYASDFKDGFFAPWDDRVLASVPQFFRRFHVLYPINQEPGLPGVAWGRYPEEGIERGRAAHPWIVSTLASAEFFYRLGAHWRLTRRIEISEINLSFFQMVAPDEWWHKGQVIVPETFEWDAIMSRLKSWGDSQLARVSAHMDRASGELREQFHRRDGQSLGASHSTWSHLSFLSASKARSEFLKP
jgi:glucoamylase